MSSDGHHLIINTLTASRIPDAWRLPTLRRGATPLEELAHAEAVEAKKDENSRKFQLLMYQVRELGIYKSIKVNMYGVNGNALVVLGTVRAEMSRCGVPDDHIAIFTVLAMSGRFEKLLETCDEWVTIVNERPQQHHDAWGAFKKLKGK